MHRQTAQLFFSLLTLGALASAVGVVVLQIAARRSAVARRVRADVAPAAVPIAAVLAIVSMAGSLYFSEIADYLPCTLCWYQRIAMYSLAVILPIAGWRGDRSVRVYAIPLAAIGATIALYHWLLERFPSIDAGVCSLTVPCEFVWFERFGFVTLPFMALAGFSAIIAWLSLTTPSPAPDAPDIDAASDVQPLKES